MIAMFGNGGGGWAPGGGGTGLPPLGGKLEFNGPLSLSAPAYRFPMARAKRPCKTLDRHGTRRSGAKNPEASVG